MRCRGVPDKPPRRASFLTQATDEAPLFFIVINSPAHTKKCSIVFHADRKMLLLSQTAPRSRPPSPGIPPWDKRPMIEAIVNPHFHKDTPSSALRPRSSVHSPVHSPVLFHPLFHLLFVVINSDCPETGRFTPNRASTSNAQTLTRLTRSHSRNCPVSPLLFVVINSPEPRAQPPNNVTHEMPSSYPCPECAVRGRVNEPRMRPCEGATELSA